MQLHDVFRPEYTVPHARLQRGRAIARKWRRILRPRNARGPEMRFFQFLVACAAVLWYLFICFSAGVAQW